jgi:hypothetical protein
MEVVMIYLVFINSLTPVNYGGGKGRSYSLPFDNYGSIMYER